MTTTPGAVRGIHVVGARKHSTLQAMAPRRTTTLSTDVRIHPAPPSSSLFVSRSFLQVHKRPWLYSRVSLSLPVWSYMMPRGLFMSLGIWHCWSRAVRWRMRVREGHGCCRVGGLFRRKDVDSWTAAVEPAVEAGSRQQQMWPVTGVCVCVCVCACVRVCVGIWKHWLWAVSNHWKCWQPRVPDVIKPDLEFAEYLRWSHSVLFLGPGIQTPEGFLFFFTSSLRLFHHLSLQLACSFSSSFLLKTPLHILLCWLSISLSLHSSICVSISLLALTAGVPYPGLFMSSKISH